MDNCATPPVAPWRQSRSGLVKIAIPIPTESPGDQHYEWLFARHLGKVTASGGGIYRLHNTAYMSSFSIDDQVEVRRVGQRLEVVALHRRGKYTTWYVAWGEDADPKKALALQRMWRDAGAWVENICEHRVVISVDERARKRPTWAELILLWREAPLHDLYVRATPRDRPDDPDLFSHLRAA